MAELGMREAMEGEPEKVKLIALCSVPDSKVLGYFFDRESCEKFAKRIKHITTGLREIEVDKNGDKYYINGEEITVGVGVDQWKYN